MDTTTTGAAYSRQVSWFSPTSEHLKSLVRQLLGNCGSPNGVKGLADSREKPATNEAIPSECPSGVPAIRSGRGRPAVLVGPVVARLLADLFCSWSYDPAMYVGLPLRKQWYTTHRHRLPKGVTYITVKRAFDLLSAAGWLDVEPGYADLRSGDGGRQTVMRASPVLVALFDGSEAHEVEPLPPHLLVSVEDDDERPVKLDRSDRLAVKRMAEQMEGINHQLRSSIIGMSAEPLAKMKAELRDEGKPVAIFHRVQLHRVFNNDLAHGGRLYGGWWQEIPRDYRQHIIIDGRPTVELDYSNLHISMAYDLAKVQKPDGDLYDLSEYGWSEQWRPIIKRLTNALINAESDDAAMGSLLSAATPSKRRKLAELWKPFLLDPLVIAGRKEHVLSPMLDAIRQKHSTIVHLFSHAFGHRFQQIDSAIAAVVCHVFARAGVTVLPVHDSFIASEGQEKNLKKTMQGIYAHVWHEFDIGPRNDLVQFAETLYARAAPDIRATQRG